MQRPKPHQDIAPVHNPKNIKTAVLIGTPNELGKATYAIRRLRNPTHTIGLCTVDENGAQRGPGEFQKLLESHIRNAGKDTLIITDIGEAPRVYPFEIALEQAGLMSGASVHVLTDKQECIGTRNAFQRFVSERGIRNPAILENLDGVWFNSGDQAVFETIIRHQEDYLNHLVSPEHSILVAEDTPQYYTAYLNSLVEKTQHRVRALLATTDERAREIIGACKELLMGAIFDVQLPKGGELVKDYWVGLLGQIKSYDERAPIIVQSAEKEWLNDAEKEPRVFPLWKKDPVLPYKLGKILDDYFGFGDFVFRHPLYLDIEFARVQTLRQLYFMIQAINPDSLADHASHNDFSRWLWLHNYKSLAAEFKPIQVSDPSDPKQIQDLRQALLDKIEKELSPRVPTLDRKR